MLPVNAMQFLASQPWVERLGWTLVHFLWEGALISVPTTKILASGHFTRTLTPEEWKTIMPNEVRETVKLYLAGKIDQWYVKQDQSGVVFIMNLTDPEEAHELLAKLPLGQAGLMEFQIIPLGPLSPLRSLLSGPPQ